MTEKSYPFVCFMEDSDGAGVEGLTDITIDARKVLRTDITARSSFLSGVSVTAEFGGGFYGYQGEEMDLELYYFPFKMVTADAGVTFKEVPGMQFDNSDVPNADVPTSTRATPADVTTTLAISSTAAAAVADNQVAVSQSYTTTIAITSTLTADLSAATKVWFAVKRSLDKDQTADTDSIILIEDTAGLTYLNEAAYATSAHGTLVVTGSSGAWVITITIQEDATKLISESFFGTYPMEVKAIVASDTQYISGGTAVISKRLIQSIS